MRSTAKNRGRNGESLKHDFEHHGFAVIERMVPTDLLQLLRAEADRLLAASEHRAGVRNALSRSAMLSRLAGSGPPAEVAREVLGPRARPTKLTLFDKTATANWKVPWHQDSTVSVRERREADGFGPWSVKDGVPHVQPPLWVLQSILAIRLHLDDTPPDNGALHVLGGTHRLGRLSDVQVDELRGQIPAQVCVVPAGGAMLMSPLLLHASKPTTNPTRRRVLHFEFSAADLPAGLAWA
jgi:hypothetical protein